MHFLDDKLRGFTLSETEYDLNFDKFLFYFIQF